MAIPTTRFAPDSETVLQKLGLLKDMPGTWTGEGFNLIARPNFEESANLYLQLNQTEETLKLDPIGSPIPNRGFDQNDIELVGLTYLDQIHDASHGGALHIEPGIWVTQPTTTSPQEAPQHPNEEQIIGRMASIPHGNAVLVRGIARKFAGLPTLEADGAKYNGSIFPSFNSTPFPAGTPILAAGSSELSSKPAPPRFEQYNLAKVGPPEDQRTPLNADEPALPAQIELNIATRHEVSFLEKANEANLPGKPPLLGQPVAVTAATEAPTQKETFPGVENIPFLQSAEAQGKEAGNAHTVLVYATFWIEKVDHPHKPSFMQLQYAQTTILNFPIFAALHPAPAVPPAPPKQPAVVNIGWPHISVGTLRRTFL